MRNIVLILLLIVANTVVMAGNTDPEAKYSIKGTVTDETGEPLAGVEVVIEGTGKKAYTDFDGNFEIDQLHNGAYTVMFSYVAYKEAKTVLKTIQNSDNQQVVKLQKKTLKTF